MIWILRSISFVLYNRLSMWGDDDGKRRISKDTCEQFKKNSLWTITFMGQDYERYLAPGN